jgi:hypothetical protein
MWKQYYIFPGFVCSPMGHPFQFLEGKITNKFVCCPLKSYLEIIFMTEILDRIHHLRPKK